MYLDVVDLRDFYREGLGQTATRMIRRRLRDLWPDLSGMTVVGLGYAPPYLAPYREEASRVLAFMPEGQGVLRWPAEGASLTALTEESELPLADSSVDRMLVVHGLEGAGQIRPYLREIWRVLADDGRLIVVAANRAGIWARVDRTPFGHGHPYTSGQLERLLRDSLFTPVETSSALFIPPLDSRFLMATAPAWERLGHRWFSRIAGVVIVEAAKQVYAGLPARGRRLRGRLIPLANPVARSTLDDPR